MDFKRGEIVKVYYQRSTCIGHHIAQEICVKSGKDYYQLCWPILQNNDLLFLQVDNCKNTVVNARI